MMEMLVTLKVTHQTPASHKDEYTSSTSWGNHNVISVLEKKPSFFALNFSGLSSISLRDVNKRVNSMFECQRCDLKSRETLYFHVYVHKMYAWWKNVWI